MGRMSDMASHPPEIAKTQNMSTNIPLKNPILVGRGRGGASSSQCAGGVRIRRLFSSAYSSIVGASADSMTILWLGTPTRPNFTRAY